MNPQDPGPRVRKFQDPGAAIEALVRWDELAPADLRAIEADPHLAPRLETLQAVEEWLARGGAVGGACPSAEELYDYGGGPGSQALAPEAVRRIDDHLFGCTACEELLLTLAEAPPSPLVLDPLPATIAAPRRRQPPALAPILELGGRTSRRRRIQRVALACAASLVVGSALWLLFDARETSLRLPAAPLLRGENELALHYPRGTVLEQQGWMPAAGLPLRFELQPVAGAESYRVEILRHAGGAFDPGTPAGELRGGPSELQLAARLAPGEYTWRAFATVHGLERELGARDFVVQNDPALLARLAAAAGSSELARTCERIRILHEAGDWTDARELARTLPPSSERERYLAEIPGR